jgi:hypothetical protein
VRTGEGNSSDRRRRAAVTRQAVAATAMLTALLAAACGGSVQQAGSAHPPAGATSAPRQVAMAAPPAGGSGQVDAQLVNAVCEAIRQGAPAALAAPFTTARISRYLNEAQPVARRVEISLRRMARTGGGPGLRRLVRAFASLRALYAATPALAHDAGGAERAGRQIAALEGAVSVTSRHAGFPACAIA